MPHVFEDRKDLINRDLPGLGGKIKLHRSVPRCSACSIAAQGTSSRINHRDGKVSESIMFKKIDCLIGRIIRERHRPSTRAMRGSEDQHPFPFLRRAQINIHQSLGCRVQSCCVESWCPFRENENSGLLSQGSLEIQRSQRRSSQIVKETKCGILIPASSRKSSRAAFSESVFSQYL